MRLINCKELFLKEFVVDPPKYAVLSHRWYEFEVAFQDFHTVQDDRELVLDDREKQGIRKIQNTCRVALEYGLEWVWIDTCCIDKNNNTELSEAINSMYRWYANATLCLIYLADVAALKDLKSAIGSSGAGRCKNCSHLGNASCSRRIGTVWASLMVVLVICPIESLEQRAYQDMSFFTGSKFLAAPLR